MIDIDTLKSLVRLRANEMQMDLFGHFVERMTTPPKGGKVDHQKAMGEYIAGVTLLEQLKTTAITILEAAATQMEKATTDARTDN